MSRVPAIIDPSLRAAWWRFGRLWRPMALWTFLTWVLIGLVVVPLTVALSNRIAFRGDRAILGNEDLIAWMMEPAGLAYLLVLGVLSIVGVVARFAGLFRMVTDDMTGRSANVVRTLFALFSDFPGVIRLCFAAAGAGLILVIPLAGGLAVVYAAWLTDYDINYYLVTRPPEWDRALFAAAIWCGVWGIGTTYLLLRSLLAAPAYLDGHRPLRRALRQSWLATRGDSLRVLGILLVLSVAWLLVRALAHGAWFTISASIAVRVASVLSSLTPLLVVVGGYAAGTLVIDALLSFVGFSFVATVLAKIYYEDTHLHDAIDIEPSDRRAISRELLLGTRWILHPVRVLAVLLIGTLSVTLLTDRLTGGSRPGSRIVVMAHRAGMHLAVENTLEALERSIEAGADFAEIDVQTTRDSVVVVFHDADLMRLAADPRRIARTNYADLKGVDFGCVDADPNDCLLATLEEFIVRARGRIGLGIELKYYGSNPYLAEAVVELLRSNNFISRDDVMIMSLNLEAVRQVRQLAPEISTGYLSRVSIGNLTRLPVNFVAVTPRTATDRFLRTTRRNGFDVFVWTVNDAAALLDLVERDIDGVITDDPELMVRLLEGLDDLTPIERLMLSFQPLLLEAEGR